MPRARNAIRRRLPKQERSRRLVDAILEAARLVLAESGSEALTTVNVAQRAGVSVGSLYQYFAGRDALLFAIYEHELAGFRETWRAWRARSAESDGNARIREGLALALAHYRRLAALEPAFFLAHRGEILQGAAPARAGASSRGRLAALETRQRARTPSRRDPGGDEVARFMLARGIRALLDAALASDPALLSDAAFEAEIASLASRYRSRARS